MAYFKTRKFEPNRFDSLIADGVFINGPIAYVGHLMIAGEVNGDLNSSAQRQQVTLADAITVKGNVTSNQINGDFLVVELGGVVNVNQALISEKIIVKKGGTLNGDKISYKQLIVEDGARISGTLCFISYQELANENVE